MFLNTSIAWILPIPERPLWKALTIGAFGAIFLSAGSFLMWHSGRVQFTADGHVRRLSTKAERVADFLTEQHIVLGPKDFVTPPLDTRLTRNEAVRVTRVIERPVVVRHWTPPAVHSELRTSTNLRGVLAQKGYATLTNDTMLVTFYDGREARRRLLQQKVTRQPFYRLTLFDGKGAAIKTYDLLKAKTMKSIATAYYVGDPLVPSDTTYCGYKLRRGLIAVDPKVIPLHTRLYVPGYGYGYAADTGSRIKKNRIDLAVKDHHEERRYMHRPMTVYILDKTARW